MNKWFLFANFGAVDAQNGQVQKARALRQLFSRELGPRYVEVDLRTQPSALLRIFRLFHTGDVLCVSLGRNGIRIFALVWLLARILLFWRRPPRLYYFVVGGWVGRIAARSWLLRRLLRSADCAFVETSGLAAELAATGVRVQVFPNFRKCPHSSSKALAGGPLRLCFCARIVREKGPLAAIELVRELELIGTPAILDFYGPIDAGIATEFRAALRPGVIEHRGAYSSEAEAIEIMRRYDFMILPSRYPGECMPGAVVEAFCAATPVVVSDWRYLPEIVDHGLNGLVIELDGFAQVAAAWLARILREGSYESFSRASLATATGAYSEASALAILNALPDFRR